MPKPIETSPPQHSSRQAVEAMQKTLSHPVTPAAAPQADFLSYRPKKGISALASPLEVLRAAASKPSRAQKPKHRSLASVCLPLGTLAQPLQLEAADAKGMAHKMPLQAKLLATLLGDGVSDASIAACRKIAAQADKASAAEEVLAYVCGEALFRRAELRREGPEDSGALSASLLRVIQCLADNKVDTQQLLGGDRYEVSGRVRGLALLLHDVAAFDLLSGDTPPCGQEAQVILKYLATSPYHRIFGDAATTILRTAVHGAFTRGQGTKTDRRCLLFAAMSERSLPCLAAVLEGTAHVDDAMRDMDADFLHIAASKPWPQGVACLLDHGFDANARQQNATTNHKDLNVGTTPLHQAAAVKTAAHWPDANKAALYLLKAGANPRAQGTLALQGRGPLIFRTPADEALSQGNSTLAAMLLRLEEEAPKSTAENNALYREAANSLGEALRVFNGTSDVSARVAAIRDTLAPLHKLLRSDIRLVRSTLGSRITQSVLTGIACVEERAEQRSNSWAAHASRYLLPLARMEFPELQKDLAQEAMVPPDSQRRSMASLLGVARVFGRGIYAWRLTCFVQQRNWTAANTLLEVAKDELSEDDVCCAYAHALQCSLMKPHDPEAEPLSLAIMNTVRKPRGVRLMVEAALLVNSKSGLASILDHAARHSIAFWAGDPEDVNFLLHQAIESSPLALRSIAKALGDNGPWDTFLGAVDEEGNTPWHIAARKGGGMVSLLLELTQARNGLDIKNNAGCRPIDDVISAANLDDLNALLADNPEAIDGATLEVSLGNARELQASLFDKLARNAEGFKVLRRIARPLMARAARAGNTRTLEVLIGFAPDLAIKSPVGKSNLLHAIALSGRSDTLDVVRNRLSEKDPDAATVLADLAELRDEGGQTPVDLAWDPTMRQALKRLVQADATPERHENDNVAMRMSALANQVFNAPHARMRETAVTTFLTEITRINAAASKDAAAMTRELGWQVAQCLHRARNGAGMGYHFAAHQPDLGPDALETLQQRIVVENKPGASRFGIDDAIGLLHLRSRALDNARRAHEDGHWEAGRFVVELEDPRMHGKGFVTRRGSDQTEWFEDSRRVRFVMHRIGNDVGFVSMYPVPAEK